MNNKFKEANLGPDFCQDQIQEFKNLINSSTSFSVIGIPGMGISMFLKYLATKEFAYFVHIDINELPILNKNELFKLVLTELGQKGNDLDFEQLIGKCKLQLQKLTQQYPKIVLIFNRFDRLKKEFNQDFFANLRVLRDIDKEKIILIFAANKPLIDQTPQGFGSGNLTTFGKTFYLKTYPTEDLRKLVNLNLPNLKHRQEESDMAIKLCGGHYQLLHLLLISPFLNSNPLLDPAVKTQLKELIDFLNYHQKKQLQKIVLKKKVKEMDQFLLDLGFVKKSNGDYQIFTPLLNLYLKSTMRMKLPAKEAKLFQILKDKIGKVVLKEDIFNILWEDSGEASDWALNALIYRLRKNPTFASSGYVIENYKKIGYILLKA